MSCNSRYIIVLGTTYSGSGAVYDFLAGRGDFYDPIKGKEYLLPQSPNGLMCLETAAGQAFHHAISDYAVVKFLHLANLLARPSGPLGYGDNLSGSMPQFLSLVDEFVRSVVVSEMPIRLLWRGMEEFPFKRLLNYINHRFNHKALSKVTYILDTPDKIVIKARAFHDNLFYDPGNNSPILLNQAGSGWNPVESTKFFNNRKVLLIERDPRDQFAELKKYKGACDVSEFVKWYRALQGRLSRIESEVLLKIRFEDFVLKHTESVERLCSFLDVSKEVKSDYKAVLSEKNIGKFPSVLTPSEIEQIEIGCSY